MKKFQMNLCGSLLGTVMFLSAACVCAPRSEQKIEEADTMQEDYAMAKPNC